MSVRHGKSAQAPPLVVHDQAGFRDLRQSPIGNAARHEQPVVQELEVRCAELQCRSDELRAALQRLEQAHDRYEHFYDSAPVGFLTLDWSGVIQEANLTAAEMLAVDRGRLPGMRLTTCLVGSDVAVLEDYLRRTRETGQAQTCEATLARAEGPALHVQLRSTAVAGRGGTDSRCRMTMNDITELWQSRETLRESETKYCIVADNTYDWEHWRSPDGQFLYVSPSCERITGYCADRFMADAALFMQIVHPGDRAAVERHWLEEAHEHKPADLEFRILRANGECRWIAHVCQPVFDADGVFLGWRGSNRDITKQKQVEDKLRESEDKFRHFFEHSGVAKSITLPSGEVQVNDAFCKMLGYTTEELLHRKWQDISHPDDIGATQEIVDSLLSGATTMARFFKRYLHKNGSIVWADVSTSLRRDAEGKPLYFMTTANDITGRQRAEEALRIKNLVFDLSIAANSIADVTGTITQVNDAFLKTWGYSDKSEVIGKPIPYFLVDSEEAAAIIQALADHGAWEGDCPARRKDGTTFIAHGLATIMRDDSGKHIGYQSAVIDISARVEAEEERDRILNMSADLICVTGGDGYFKYVNPAWERTLGYATEYLLSRPFLTFIHPEDHHKNDEEVARLAAGIPSVDFENRYIHRDGSIRIISWTANPLPEKGLVYCVGRDITDRRRTEETERRLQQELNQVQKMETIGQIGAGIAHDVNNMLMAIAGYSALARMTLSDQKQAAANLGYLDEAVQDAGAITQTMLMFSRKAPPEKHPVTVQGILHDTLRMIRRLLPASVQIEVVSPAEPGLWVLADRTQVQQVLLNLAVNARDAMPDGGTLRFSLTGDAERAEKNQAELVAGTIGEVSLSVSDSGSGISPEALPKVFEPFFTTKSASGGTGLGLSIVKNVIGDLGGRIEVESQPDRGTTFVIRLPRIAPPGPSRDDTPSQRLLRGHGEMILVAEDCPSVLHVLSGGLRQANYEVLTAADAAQAIARYATWHDRVQLLILDLDMPNGSGTEVLRSIRQGSPGIPAIIITGNVALTFDAIVNERTRVLRKPYRLTEFVELASQLLTAHPKAEMTS